MHQSDTSSNEEYIHAWRKSAAQSFTRATVSTRNDYDVCCGHSVWLFWLGSLVLRRCLAVDDRSPRHLDYSPVANPSCAQQSVHTTVHSNFELLHRLVALLDGTPELQQLLTSLSDGRASQAPCAVLTLLEDFWRHIHSTVEACRTGCSSCRLDGAGELLGS